MLKEDAAQDFVQCTTGLTSVEIHALQGGRE